MKVETAIADVVTERGAVVAPAAGVLLASKAVPAGIYRVEVTSHTSAADSLNNCRFRSNAADIGYLATPLNPVQQVFERVTHPGGNMDIVVGPTAVAAGVTMAVVWRATRIG